MKFATVFGGAPRQRGIRRPRREIRAACNLQAEKVAIRIGAQVRHANKRV